MRTRHRLRRAPSKRARWSTEAEAARPRRLSTPLFINPGSNPPLLIITRPAITEPRLSLTPSGNVRYQLKTPYRDGTTHVIFEPLDFMARLAALVPRPRVNLTRYHGVFAPNSPWRGAITPGRRGKGAQRQASDEVEEDTPAVRRSAMTWAQRLKRVFRIDVETCQACGGAMKIIASIEDPAVIGKILAHLEQTSPGGDVMRLPGPRAPPDG